ncbi:hypothetical protein [Aeromicrobium sp. UC242_57]|uniref:hypothetical protein n=1 Tax=Aeromicrobium sp. UC242_57 TaxID=3374624 RepID=UPI00378BC9D7
MKKKLIDLLLLLLVAGGVVALALGVMMWGDDPAAEEKAPAVPKVVYMSTDGVVANIERRLEGQTGYGLKARCPKKVDEAVGTTFRCSVRRDGQDDKIAIATVEINGKGGQFTWTSEPYPKPAAG